MPAETSCRLMPATFALVMVMVLAPEVFARDKKPKPSKAPEIDMNAATKGLATLVTGFLLVGERLRRRR